MSRPGRYLVGRTLSQTIEAYSIPEPNTGCWIWEGALRNGKYGCLNFQGTIIQAHRASWIAFRGPFSSPDQCVCHKCDVTLCVNPDHLFVGTQIDNVSDMITKGRAPIRKRGQESPTAKLTEDDVRTIRSLRLPYRAIGRRYGVTKYTIYNIVKRRAWAWVQ